MGRQDYFHLNKTSFEVHSCMRNVEFFIKQYIPRLLYIIEHDITFLSCSTTYEKMASINIKLKQDNQIQIQNSCISVSTAILHF